MIVLGRIVAPFGVNGWLKVHPFGDDPLSWRTMPTWWISQRDDSPRIEDWKPCKPRGVRAHGKSIVLALDEVADRTAAEAVAGWFLAAPREALPKPAQDEYYWADLIGLSVVNAAGLPLGVVESLVETGAHAVLVVKEDEVERLIPFVGAYIVDVDVDLRRIRVNWEIDW